MKIRPFRPGDRPTVARIHAASWRDAYRGALPDDYLETRVADELHDHWRRVEVGPRDVVQVAVDDEPVGFIAVWCRPEPYIDNLHVLPGARSRGTGRALMVAAADALMRQGQTTAYLWVLSQNRRAIGFYEGLGGRVAEEAVSPVFGHDLPQYRIAWNDLSVIVARKD